MRFTYSTGSRPLDGYTIKRGIGQGGFGEVYYAVSDGGKEVALKLVQRNLDVELRGVAQCLNLKHPNLVTLYDLRANDAGEQFVIMEYVAGKSLADVIDEHPDGMPLDRVRRWLEGICAGVGYLHERGIVHRDLKPGNLFLDEGVVKVGDYGLSKFITASRRSGQTESVGTVHYMAPEISRGRYGRQIDVYAAGIILYEMLTGKVPFDGESVGEVLMKHLTARPDLSPLPPPYDRVVARALEKDPAARFQSMGQLAASVRAGSSGTASSSTSAADIGPAVSGAAGANGGRSEQYEVSAAGQQRAGPSTAPATVADTEQSGRPPPSGMDRLFIGICIWAMALLLVFALGWPRVPLVRVGSLVPLLIAGLLLALLFRRRRLGGWSRPGNWPPGCGREPACPPVLRPAAAGHQTASAPRTGADRHRRSAGHAEAGGVEAAGRLQVNPAMLSPAGATRLRDKAAELVGSMLVAAILVVIVSLLAAGAMGLDRTEQWALLAVTSLVACWAVMLPAKWWEDRRGDRLLRRLAMAAVGLLVGLASGYLDALLQVGLFDQSLHTGAWLRAPRWIPPLLAHAGYFAILFALLDWWKLADSHRLLRFNPWWAVWPCLAAWLISVVWNHSLPWDWGMMIAGTMAVVVQLASAWRGPSAAS